jgi:hypothetical protein
MIEILNDQPQATDAQKLQAIQYLTQLGPDAIEAISVLRSISTGSLDLSLRQAAIRAIVTILPQPHQFVPELLRIEHEGKWEIGDAIREIVLSLDTDILLRIDTLNRKLLENQC